METTVKKAIIFDFDGTLLDTMHIFDSIVRHHLQIRGVILSEQREKELLAKYLSKIADLEYGGGKQAIFRVFLQIGKACGLGRISRVIFTITTIRGILRAYHTAKHFPDSQKVLSLLKDRGFLLALVTMASKNDLTKSLGDLEQYFGIIITRNDVKQIKPDPEGLIKACQALDVKSENCYAIGDLPLDIIAAQKAGITALAVTTGISSEEVLKKFNPSKIFSSLTEACNWILDQEFGTRTVI
ncbi:MAG: HAD family hydrolase [Candidatus Hodarchaeota archaeon]